MAKLSVLTWIGNAAVVRVTKKLDGNAEALVPNQVNTTFSVPVSITLTSLDGPLAV